jgi:hypothetical protein
MVATRGSAPTFTVTVGTSDHGIFNLVGYVGDNPVVLAFLIGAFTLHVPTR